MWFSIIYFNFLLDKWVDHLGVKKKREINFRKEERIRKLNYLVLTSYATQSTQRYIKWVSYYYVSITHHQKTRERRKGENRDIRDIYIYIYIYKINLKQNKKERCINDRTFNNLHGWVHLELKIVATRRSPIHVELKLNSRFN